MTEQFSVIPEINSGQALNLFQDLISGRLENKPSPQPSPIGEGAICHSEGACRSTRPIEFCINFSRHSEAQRAERIQPIMADGGQEVRRSGGQASLEGKKIRRYEGKLFSVNSLSSNPPTLLSSNNHSGGNAMLIPPYGLLVSEPEVKKSGNLDGRKLRRYEGKLFTLKSLSSNPPTLLSSNNHSGGNASLIPPYALTMSVEPRLLWLKC